MEKRRIYSELSREYDQKRAAARKEFEARRNEIYEMIPRIREIDAEIAGAGFSAGFSALDNPAAAKNLARNFRDKSEALLKEKNAILKEMGIPKKYLETLHECKLCGDTGFIDGEECACFRQRRIDMAHGSYKMKERLEKETFDNFDFRYYSSKKPDGKPCSPKMNMEKIVKYSLEYTKGFAKKRSNLLFYGKPGLGKTFLCNCIAGELINAGYSVVYSTAPSLFKLLGDAQFGKAEDGESLLNDISEADLLIIDDVGTEYPTAVTAMSFFHVINMRALNGGPVVMSTNLDPSGIKELYSERVFSRIIGDYTMFDFYGEDIRALKKYGKFLD